MLHIKEFDEDPALLQDQKASTEEATSYNQLLAVNTSIPRREFHLDLSAPTASTTRRPITRSIGKTNAWNSIRRPKQILVDLFLPLGFPHSVDASYLPYQFYDSLQGLCSYLRGVVSTSAVLTAAGVGNADANAMGAAMTWAMKDGLGMVGGLVFSYHASPYFDAYVLEFRLFADLINDVALTLDMMAPLVPPSWLLGIMSLSTLSKTMCGMSAGATKSSITVHLALEDNMADLNAKEGTQETLVSLVGMVLGVQLARWLEQLQNIYHDEPLSWNGTIPFDWQVPVEFAVSWVIFLFLTWLHVWANYRGVKILKLKTLNRERAWNALEEFVTSLAQKVCQQSAQATAPTKHCTFDGTSTNFSTIRDPDHVEESMIRATWTMFFPKRQPVALGMPLLDILQAADHPTALLQEFRHENYIATVDTKHRQVLATLRTGATSHDELKAFVHCMLLHKCLDHHESFSSAGIHGSMELIQRAHSQLTAFFDDNGVMMKQLSEKGWNVEARLYLGFGRQRTSWESKSD